MFLFIFFKRCLLSLGLCYNVPVMPRKPIAKIGNDNVMPAFISHKVGKIAESLETGVSPKDACALAGLPYAAFRSAYSQGIQDQEAGLFDTAASKFALAVDKAQASFKARQVELIASTTTWQARAWLLERSFPDEYGQRRDAQDQSEAPVPFVMDVVAEPISAQVDMESANSEDAKASEVVAPKGDA